MKPRILIVEDEPGIADTLQYALRTDGFEPVWVAMSAGARRSAPAMACSKASGGCSSGSLSSEIRIMGFGPYRSGKGEILPIAPRPAQHCFKGSKRAGPHDPPQAWRNQPAVAVLSDQVGRKPSTDR